MRPIRRGWRHRGHMPHADFVGLAQAVTFRLADSLPASAVQRLRSYDQERSVGPDAATAREDATLRDRIHAWLDAGHGSCCLRDPEICVMVLNEIRTGHGVTHRLDAAVVMPNHVHVLAKSLGEPLGTLVGRWKGRTSRMVNASLARSGALWQREYFDRFIRDDEHHIAAVRYIVQNPVSSRLVRKPWLGRGCGWIRHGGGAWTAQPAKAGDPCRLKPALRPHSGRTTAPGRRGERA